MRADRPRRPVSRASVQGNLAQYPRLVRFVQDNEDTPAGRRLRLLEAALARMPTSQYQAVRLRSIGQLSNQDAAERLGVHKNTASRRYLAGLDWLVAFISHPDTRQPLRKISWRAAVPLEGPAEDAPPPAGRRGRPQRIPLVVDVEVVRAYCAGQTQQEIADHLNARRISAVGKLWRPSSIRSILRRYNVPTRPRGRRFNPNAYQTNAAARVDYENTLRGTPLCDADELLRQAGVDSAQEHGAQDMS